MRAGGGRAGRPRCLGMQVLMSGGPDVPGVGAQDGRVQLFGWRFGKHVERWLRHGGGPPACHAALRAPAGCQAACQLALDAQGSQGIVARVQLGTIPVVSLGQPIF